MNDDELQYRNYFTIRIVYQNKEGECETDVCQ